MLFYLCITQWHNFFGIWVVGCITSFLLQGTNLWPLFKSWGTFFLHFCGFSVCFENFIAVSLCTAPVQVTQILQKAILCCWSKKTNIWILQHLTLSSEIYDNLVSTLFRPSNVTPPAKKSSVCHERLLGWITYVSPPFCCIYIPQSWLFSFLRESWEDQYQSYVCE